MKKTKVMISSNTTNRNHKLNIKCNSQMIEQVDSYKYLGLTIQNNLKWDIHINNIAALWIALCREIKTLISIYYSYMNSQLLSYLFPIWGPTLAECQIMSLRVTQNHTIRLLYINNMSTDDIYERKSNKILKIKQITKYNSTLLMYTIIIVRNRIKHQQDITTIKGTHNYGTRNSYHFTTSAFGTNFEKYYLYMLLE